MNVARAASEKRKYPRTLLNLPVDFQITDEPEAHSGIIINMSQMGILIQTSQDMPVGKKVNLEVSMGEDAAAGTFRGRGEIIWKGKKHLDDSDEYQYGIKLLEVLNEGHMKLELLILGNDEKKGE